MAKVKIELWCVQEDMHLADVEIEGGQILSDSAIKRGTRILAPEHRKRVPLGNKIEDSKLMHCRACTNALHFFTGGFATTEVPVAEVAVVETPKQAHYFDHDYEPREGTLLATWVRVKKSTREEINVRSTLPVGVVIAHNPEKGKVVIKHRETFVAVPGLGKVLA